MRVVSLVLLLMPVVCGATSYSPRGYIADVAAYYPMLSSQQSVEEAIEIRAVYGMLSSRGKVQAGKRLERIFSKSLPIKIRARMLVEEVAGDEKKLGTMPQDVKDSIASILDAYVVLPEQVKLEVAAGVLSASKGDDQIMSVGAGRPGDMGAR